MNRNSDHPSSLHFRFFYLILFFLIHPAWGWDQHHGLMPEVVSHLDSKDLNRAIEVPIKDQEDKTIQALIPLLQIRDVGIKRFGRSKPHKITINEWLQNPLMDEPDFGMDQELDDASDPTNDREFMGGKKGLGSQGFRHMEFHSWLQVPPRKLGKARERFELLTKLSRQSAQKGDFYFAFRLQFWALHYAQDLAQPFHSTQIPTLHFFPWDALLRFDFKSFVVRGTQIIGNAHLWYEEWALREFQNVPLKCAPADPNFSIDHLMSRSRVNAAPLGQLLNELWGPILKDEKNVFAGHPEQLKKVMDLGIKQKSPDEKLIEDLRRVTRNQRCDAIQFSVQEFRKLTSIMTGR